MSLEQTITWIMIICSIIGIFLSLIFIYSFFRINKLHKSPGDIYFGMSIGELIYCLHYLSEGFIFQLNSLTFCNYQKSPWCIFNLFAFTLAVIVIYSYIIQLYMHMIIRLIYTLQAKKINKWQGHLLTWIIATIYASISIAAFDQSVCGVTISKSAPFTFIILLISFLVMAITTRLYIKEEFSQNNDMKLQKQSMAFVSYLSRLFKAQAILMSSFVSFIMLAYIIEILLPQSIKSNSVSALIFASLAQISAYVFPIVMPIIRTTDPFIYKHLRQYYFKEKQSLSESNISMVEQTIDSQSSDNVQFPKISFDDLTQSLLEQDTLNQEQQQVQKQYSKSSQENLRSITQSSFTKVRKQTIKQEDPFIHQLTNQLRSEIIKRIMAMILIQEFDKIQKFKTDLYFKRSLRHQHNDDYSEQIVYNVNQMFLNEKFSTQFTQQNKKFKMIAYAPTIFHILIKQDQEKLNIINCLDLQQNLQQIIECAQTTGGKSGEFFFFNYNNKLLLKTISVEELQTLLEMTEQYFWHCTNNPNTLLAKILGIYTFENFEIGRISMILMKNIGKINKAAFKRIYDLKGSSYDREVIKQRKQSENNLQQDISESSSKVLKDLDFLKIEKQLNLQPPENINIYEQIEIDTLFLKQLGFMDYSLCIIVVDWFQFYKTTLQKESSDEQVIKKIMLSKLNKLQHCYKDVVKEGIYYHIGIIDYLQKYNLQKITEKYAKKIMKLDSNLDTSSQNPYEYRKRFLMFLKKIL